MEDHAGHSPALRVYLSINAAAFIAAGALMIAVARSGPLSTLRLILIAGTFLVGAALLAGAVTLHLRPDLNRNLYQAVFESTLRKRLVPILGIAFPIFWALAWIPPAYTSNLYYYFIGLYPLLLCGTLVCGSANILLLSARVKSTDAAWKDYWRTHRTALYVTLAALGAFVLIALVTLALGILTDPEPYWYGAGVPILAWQVFLAALITVIALHIQARPPRINLPVGLVLFVLVWAITAGLWASQPVRESFWITTPRPPNFEDYPFSDMSVFDVGSQFALIGQGLNNHAFFDRGLYMAFLVYLHAVGGQNYQHLMALQAVLFAIFPALLFLIGTRLHSRAAGILIATLATLRGLNSLTATAWIDTATFKHMLTDFPTAIGLAVLVLFLLKWMETPQENGRYLLWMGGVLGLTSLLRPHVLLLLPFILLLALWVYRARWQRVALLGGLALAAALVSVAPWMLLGSGSGSVFEFYGKRIHDVLAQRYPVSTPVASEAAPSTSPPVATLLPATSPPAASPAPPTTAPTIAAPTAVPPGAITSTPPPVRPGVPFQVAQYLHNVVTSVLIFPDSPLFLSVRDTVKGGEPFWEPHWIGDMSATAAVMLILGLTTLALGLGASFGRLRWRGLMPLGVLLIYFVANAVARTSGGRYLVPVDWIVLCYFGVGLAELLQLGGNLVGAAPASAPALSEPSPAMPGISPRSAIAGLVAFALIGALIPLAGVLYPLRYASASSAEAVVQAQPTLSRLGLAPTDVSALLAQPGAVALYGRALYPRFYPLGAGEPVRYLPFRTADYPRTVFILIGPAGQQYVILPGPAPKVLPNASDVLVLGCREFEEGYDMLYAAAVVLPSEGVGYLRSPAAETVCSAP